LVSSFNLESADRVRELDGSLPTGFLTLVGMDPVDGVDIAHAHGHPAVHPDARALVGETAAATVARAHDLGMAVNVWTVNGADAAPPRSIDRSNDRKRVTVSGTSSPASGAIINGRRPRYAHGRWFEMIVNADSPTTSPSPSSTRKRGRRWS